MLYTEDMVSTSLPLALPQGVEYKAARTIGRNVETGGSILIHLFKFHDKATGKSLQVRILADATMSRAYIEDQAAGALERWMRDLKAEAERKVGKHTPSPAERRDVGKAILEFREHAAKRRASSNQRLYYSGSN